ncbi:MAG: SDR family oxidoreductase [Chromatiales bacterium]|jgi:3-oxoacyl-[acyl-carrier protein] reductase|nr:SDR family oxidoreductase [Chromatiales bacterium]
MDLQLGGKRALITGGTRGMGRAIAETLAGEGVNLSICARKEAEVSAAVESLEAKGVAAHGACVDVTKDDDVKRWVAHSAEQLGGLDIIISNVGAMDLGTGRASWEKNFNLDVMGLVNLVDAGAPFLEAAAAEGGDAAIVAISSTAAAAITSAQSYGAVKGALIHFVKGLAKDFAPRKVRANTVAPGMVYFEGGIWSRIEHENPAAYQAALARNPMGRMAVPQDVANAVAFLSSPRASFVSGINMIVDGAMTDRVNY